MPLRRREFIQSSAFTASAVASWALAAPTEANPPIVDVHQHLWDLAKFKLPWLETAPDTLRHTFHLAQYAEATRGLNIKAVYMEVDVADDQLVSEAEHVIEISRSGKHPTVAAVIGGRPESVDFAAYLKRFRGVPEVKGVRRVLHTQQTPPGYCLGEQFVRSVRMLGEHGLSFDLAMRATDLDDGAKLTELCPDTRFVVDHCGNADPAAFHKSMTQPSHSVDGWKTSIERLAKRPNTICKISGIIARLPKGGGAEALAPIVNHCLDTFGPERVVFGSDWPVCLLGAPLKTWVEILRQIVSSRPEREQQQLWSQNALKHYGLMIR